MRPWLLAALAATLPACATQASAALTKPIPEVEQESSTQAASGVDDSGARAVGGAGTHVGPADKKTSANPGGGGAGGGGGSQNGPGGSASGGGAAGPVIKITTLNTFPNIPALPEHSAAHGILRDGGPGVGWAVGITSYDDKSIPAGGDAQSGKCAIVQSPRAFSDNQCVWHVWISEKPGGAPLGKKCYWTTSNLGDASIGGGNWYTPRTGAEAGAAKNLGYLCELPKQRTRYWCNYTATGWDAPSPPKKCDATLVFPASMMDEDLYPDSHPQVSGSRR